MTDSNPSTGLDEPLITNLGYPGVYQLLYNTATSYAGLYILSESPNYITDYHVVAQNPTTFEEVEVCRIISATSNFTVCAFVDEDGNPVFSTNLFSIYPDALFGGVDTATINEVYPIWPGDTIVNLNEN